MNGIRRLNVCLCFQLLKLVFGLDFTEIEADRNRPNNELEEERNRWAIVWNVRVVGLFR